MALNLNMFGGFIGDYKSEDRNILANGDMYLDRTNNGNSITLATGVPAYVVDVWKASLTQASAVVTAQQGTMGVPSTSVSAVAGFTKTLKITVGTGASVGAGDSLLIQQTIDPNFMRFLGYGIQSAATVSLSFWVRTSLSTNQTYSFAITNAAGNRSYVGTFPVITSANYWNQIVIPNIPGDTAGTWAGGTLTIAVACGSTNQTSTLNTWQGVLAYAANSQTNSILSTSGATFEITGIQEEPGQFCTPFSLQPYDAALLQCNRLMGFTGASYLPVQKTITGINAKTVANTALYTVPAGYQFICTSAVVRCTAASSISAGPNAGIGSTAGTSNIFAAVTMTALTGTTNDYGFSFPGSSLITASGGVVYFNLAVAATGTSQTVSVDLNGYLIANGS